MSDLADVILLVLLPMLGIIAMTAVWGLLAGPERRDARRRNQAHRIDR